MWTLGRVELRGVGPAPVLEAIARRAHVAERAAQEGREKRTKNGCNMRVAACPHGNHVSDNSPFHWQWQLFSARPASSSLALINRHRRGCHYREPTP
jgi:hypothetical protein